MEYPIDKEIKPTDHILLAYTYPFNLNDVEHSNHNMQLKCLAHDRVYFNKKVIGHSLEGRPLEQITICSQNAYLENKPVVYLTCRVHCGETPA